MKKYKIIISLIINLIISMITTGIVVSYFLGNTGPLLKYGYESFRFFTTDSNVIAAAASISVIISDIMILRGKINTYPKYVRIFKYIGTVSVMLTFCTVMLFLIHIYGPSALLSGTSFHMHFAAPLLSLISFCFIENDQKISFVGTLTGIVPMFIYAVIYIVNVVFIGEENGGWMDFYSFNSNGTWYITAVIMLCATYLISIIILLVHNLTSEKLHKLN